MPKYKVIIAYDGTNYQGWQVQRNHKSVANVLQDSFKRIFNRDIVIVGASRTDSGVHALGQVAQFKSDLDIDPNQMMFSWNNRLPDDIVIKSIERVSDDYVVFHDVVQKTYYYHLFLSRPMPFVCRFGWYYNFIDLVDLEKFEKALQIYVGEHDFRSFCRLEDDRSPIRKIDSISLKRIPQMNAIRVIVKGKSFLRFQIRRMIGYALDVARRPDLGIDYLENMLKNPSPKQTLLKAEAKGLILKQIDYKK